MGSLAEWVGAGLTTLIVLGALAANYATNESRAEVFESQMSNLVKVVEELHEKEEQTTEDLEAIKERVIRNEAGLEFMSKGQTELAVSIKELSKEIREMRKGGTGAE